MEKEMQHTELESYVSLSIGGFTEKCNFRRQHLDEGNN